MKKEGQAKLPHYLLYKNFNMSLQKYIVSTVLPNPHPYNRCGKEEAKLSITNII